MNGIVRIYFVNRGYGFIGTNNGDTYFFHISDTNLQHDFKYNLDGAKVQFTASNEIVNGEIKKRAKGVTVDLTGLKLDQAVEDPDKVSSLLKGKVIIDFQMVDKSSVPYKLYTLIVKDPETGQEAEVSFSGL